MLSLENIGIEFGGHWLLRQASYQFLPGERVGLIGRNGAGKSTLLKMLTGDITPSEGQIHKAGGLSMAYFSQDLLSFQTERPIVEVAREAFAPLLKLKAEIDHLLLEIESGKATPRAWDELDTKQARFDTQGGKLIDAQVHSVLTGLGFSPELHHQPFHTFSGGWRMRVLLAKMLLTQPDILLLDEPTNHLDLPSIRWLESYLKGFRGCCILVSHDRFFIDRMAEKILEISLGQLHTYSGNYSYYLKEKALRQELHQRAFENQQKHIAEQERFINRFRAKASKARQVQSKIKGLERLDKIAAPEEEHISLKIRFKPKVNSGKEVLGLKEVNKSYGKLNILEESSGSIWRGDKIGLIGANGLGKSTLLRIMADTEPFEGERKLGHQVIPSFFAQHQLEALTMSNDILEEVSQESNGKTETEIRSILGAFMFSGEDTEKKIRVLSGGEKSRVALAKTLLSEANFLLLDEPTNHLDIPSIQILVEALQEYAGTYVVVSHDRFFLEKVTNKIWYIENHQIKEYPGNYREFQLWYDKIEEQARVEDKKEENKAQEQESKQDSQLSYKEQKQRRNRIKKLEKIQAKLEEEIQQLEEQSNTAHGEMARPENAANFNKLSELQDQYDQLQKKMEAVMAEWEAVVLELEELA